MPGLTMNSTAAVVQEYAVPLPERLIDGDFQVYRCAPDHTYPR